jgi:hypothetical protein
MHLLKNARWIPLRNGKLITVEEHKIVPAWFDVHSRKTIFDTLPVLGDDEILTEISNGGNSIDNLLLKCGCQLYGAKEYGIILCSVDAVSLLKDSFLGKIWGYAIRCAYYSPSSLSDYFVRNSDNCIIQFSEITAPVEFTEEFVKSLKSVLNEDELVKVCDLTAFKSIRQCAVAIGTTAPSIKKSVGHTKIEYSKWKTPIQNCIVSEQLQGHTAKDVSKKSLGYDIESTDKTGKIKYLSVKPVETLGNAFVLSELEFVYAERHGVEYGVYVIETGNPENNMLIEDIGTLTFEKRVKEWEWVSGTYEVSKPIKADETVAIDSGFVKNFSLKYLNRVQIAFLKTLCEEGDIHIFEEEYSCRSSSIVTQINSIADFYLGDSIIEIDMKLKDKYVGGVKYLLAQEC